MSYVCDYCEFSAPTNSRFKKHLLTQKHARNIYLQQELDETVQESRSSQDLQQELDETVQESRSSQDLQQELDETVQESRSSQDLQQELDDQLTSNGYHITYDDDLQYINPIFLDMDTFKFLQNIKNVINSNPYIIYILGFAFTLYSSVDQFLYPKDDTIEYIDCVLKED